MKTIALATLALLAAAPAAAQTAPMIIYKGTPDRITVTSTPDEARLVEIAAEDACAKPFLRDLKGRMLYAECLAEARAEAWAILAERTVAQPELAMR